MAYFKIDDTDFSMYVNALKVAREHTYKGMTNASGNTLVKYVNTKRIIEVGIIPLDDASMKALQEAINAFKVSVSFRDPLTNALEENVVCMIPTNSVEYYTIRADKVSYKAFTLQMKEL